MLSEVGQGSPEDSTSRWRQYLQPDRLVSHLRRAAKLYEPGVICTPMMLGGLVTGSVVLFGGGAAVGALESVIETGIRMHEYRRQERAAGEI